MSTVTVGPGISLSGPVLASTVQIGPGVGQALTMGSPTLSGAVTNVPKTIREVIIAESFYYEHEQTAPASEWTVTHNLGKRPNVSVIDSDGEEVLVEVDHIDMNTIHILWPTPSTGTVICS